MALLPPIHNPEVPYVGPIDRGFTPGEMVRIQGKTNSNTARFSVNLQCGPNKNPRDDIALHVSIRVADNYVVFNTLENGQWGKEQIPDVPLPIGPNQHFEVLLLCDEHDYKLALNGQHFAEFKHRLPGDRVTHLSIDGEVEISLICYEGGTPSLPETSSEAPVSYSETNKDNELTLDDFKPSPSAPPVVPGYRLPPPDDFNSPAYRPQGYGGPQGPGNYGPTPPQGGYGSSGHNFPPQGSYGPGPQGGYGPGPQGGYGPQPHQQDSKSSDGGMFENLLGQAGTAIAGALASGALTKMLGQNQPAQHGPIGGGYPGYQGPGGGPLSNLLNSFTQNPTQSQGQGGGAGGLLSGLLNSALSQPTQQQGQQQPHGNTGGLGGFLSDAFSQFGSGGQNRHY